MKYNFPKLFFVSVLMFSCKKDNLTQSTSYLLQNRWSINNETTVLPNECGGFQREIYNGTPTDYFLFNKNDSVAINRAGEIGISNNPLNIILGYTLTDNNTIIFINPSNNYHDTATILKITTDSLILKNKLSYSIPDLCIPADTAVNGVASDTLRLYR